MECVDALLKCVAKQEINVVGKECAHTFYNGELER